MTDLLQTFAPDAADLVLMVVVVLLFLRYLAKRDEMLEKITEACHDVQRESLEVHRETRTAIVENSKALGEFSEVVRRCNGTPGRGGVR